MVVRVIAESSEAEMVACFLLGELTSDRFGAVVREALAVAGLSEQVVTRADLTDETANRARRDLLGLTRGYGQNRDVFDEDFPMTVDWIRAELDRVELTRVRYIDDSYWNELSGGSRLPVDAAARIRQGVLAFGISNSAFIDAARTLVEGKRFPPLILVGPRRDGLVCLEGHLRLTAHALAEFPVSVECLVGTAASIERWTH